MPVYVSQRKLVATLPEIDEPIGPVDGSRWDTPDAVRMRILSASDDYPLSARWIGQGAQAFYSLRTTILRSPDRTFSELYRRVLSFDFGGYEVSWSPEEFIFVAVDTRLVMGGEIDAALVQEIRGWLTDVPPDTIDATMRDELTDDLQSWYLRKKRIYRDTFEQSVHILQALPALDRSIDNADPTWRPFLDAPPPSISPDLRTLVYDYTPDPGCDPTCVALFQRISVAAWPPAPMSLAVCLQQGCVGHVQTATGQMPFPTRSFPPEFFPWDEDAGSKDMIFLYRTELGWASLHLHETASIRLSLIEDAHTPTGADKMPMSTRLDAWEEILGGFVIRRATRRIEDLGVRLRLVFSDIPMEGFSWLIFYDALINDPVMGCFLSLAPEKLTLQMPNPRIDDRASPVVPQQMALDWTPYACRLWSLDARTAASASSSRSDRSGLQAAVMIREEPTPSLTVVLGLTTPVPEASIAGIVEFFRHLLVHVGAYRPTTAAWFDRTDRAVLRQGEKIFFDFLRRSHRISPETDLTKRLPTLFVTPFYKSLCQLPLQPRMVEEEEAKALSCGEELCDDNRRLRFPPQEMHGVSPAWYVCPSARFPYPGLKKNNMENALFPLVPCCFEKPQLANNREKMLKMSLGVDIVSTKRKDNIIQKHHIIRHQGQRGLPPSELQDFFVAHYPLHQVYRIGMNWTPFSFLECLHYVQVNGVSMPLAAWYPAHLVNLLQRHSGLVVGCMPFHTAEDIIHRIQKADRDFWVDPQLFLTFFEQIFRMRILVWVEDAERERDYRLLRSDRAIDPPPTHAVYILQHRGGRMDRLAGRPYPQCELLEWHPLTRSGTPSSPLFLLPAVLRRPIPPPHPLQARLRYLRYQAVFPTGQIRAIRTPHLTLWIEPPSCPSLDLDFWDPFTDGPSSFPTTALLRQEWERLGIRLDPNVRRYATSRGASRTRHLLLWRGIFNDSSLTVWAVTEDIPRHGVEEVVPSARIVPVSEPPIWLAAYCHPNPLGRVPRGLDNVWSPTVLRRNGAILLLLRDATVFRFSQWMESPEVRALETMTLPEKIQEFLRTQSVVRPDHYETLGIFPALLPLSYGEATGLCTDPMGRLLLPSEGIRSRLFYYLQWKSLYEADAPAPRPTGVRTGAFVSGDQWRTADPHNALWPLPIFKKLWENIYESSAPTARRVDPAADPWATTLPHDPSSYVVYTIEGKDLEAFLQDECPPGRPDLPITSMILTPASDHADAILPPETVEILAGQDRTCAVWTGEGWTVISPRTPPASSSTILIVPDPTGVPTTLGVIVHPSFF